MITEASRPHPNPLPKGEGTGSPRSTLRALAPRSLLLAPCSPPAPAPCSLPFLLRCQRRLEIPHAPLATGVAGRKYEQRRDWIFLFESSADRNPLLARAQVEIVKTILDNAEHDDTFSILTAATRVHAYQAEPQTATPANVEQAVRFLENVHLVGALDLGRAFDGRAAAGRGGPESGPGPRRLRPAGPRAARPRCPGQARARTGGLRRHWRGQPLVAGVDEIGRRPQRRILHSD